MGIITRLDWRIIALAAAPFVLHLETLTGSTGEGVGASGYMTTVQVVAGPIVVLLALLTFLKSRKKEGLSEFMDEDDLNDEDMDGRTFTNSLGTEESDLYEDDDDFSMSNKKPKNLILSGAIALAIGMFHVWQGYGISEKLGTGDTTAAVLEAEGP